MALAATGVGHTYRKGEPGEVRALDGIDVSFEPGELALVTGAAGSGKSTLLQCLAGLVRPTTGRVTADGVDASKARGVVAMSIQFPERALFASTIYDDVAFGPGNLGLAAGEVKSRVIEALKCVGLGEELWAMGPRALSHGQRRLSALAGVIAVRPRYLLLDEPTAGLDSRGKGRVLRVLGELNRSGTAIVVASHDLGQFLSVCRRIVMLDRGRIALDGKPDLLATRDDIGSLGLALPPSVVAARRLRSRGIDAPWNIGPEELAGHLRRMEHEGARVD